MSSIQLYRGNQIDASKQLATVSKVDTFTAKLRTEGTRWLLWINGKQVGSGNFSREGKSTTLRYGAYHHGKGVAKIHVTDARFQLDSTARLAAPAP